MGVDSEVNRSRLKEKLLNHCQSQCQEQSAGRSRMLVFTTGLCDLLTEVTHKHETDVLAMAQVVEHIRKDIFDKSRHTFHGYLAADCQSTSIPRLLLSIPILLLNFVSLLLNGTSIKDAQESQSCPGIARLIYFNAKKKHQ